MHPIVIFLFWFFAAEALLTALRLALKKRKLKTGARIALAAAKALLGIAFGALVLAGPVFLRFAQPFMMALYVALLADAAADLLYTVVCALRKRERSFKTATALSLVFGILLFSYGTCNMQIVTPRHHTYTSEKLTDTHTLVFLADLHVGSAQSFAVTEKTINEIKALQPDCIIMGGDIVDDYTTKEEMEQTFALFADFENPVYFVYGNHDRQGHAEYAGGRKFTEAELEQAMEKNGVIVLKDEYVQLSPDLLLLGREDLTEGDGRAAIETLPNPAPEAYLLVVDHQPGDVKNNAKTGMDLQLSGHTHAGQLFPLKALYSAIGYVYGDYDVGDAVLNVSAGACGWRMPLRTDAHCNYEVVTLQPQTER